MKAFCASMQDEAYNLGTSGDWLDAAKIGDAEVSSFDLKGLDDGGDM